MTNSNPPQIGMLYKIHGIMCRIVKVYPAGTMDVVSLDGSRSFRVTGLPFR